MSRENFDKTFFLEAKQKCRSSSEVQPHQVGVSTKQTMASSYNVEPPPYGRVLIKTTMGPLDVELFTKETPQTCRSFLQLCLEGYYDNVIFHRIIKDFIIQTGDPTGTGTGG